MSDSKAKFRSDLDAVLADLKATLERKNEAYGDSALSPMFIFTPPEARSPVTIIKQQLDHKFSRLVRGAGSGDTEDSLMDIVGYWALLQIAKRRQGGV